MVFDEAAGVEEVCPGEDGPGEEAVVDHAAIVVCEALEGGGFGWNELEAARDGFVIVDDGTVRALFGEKDGFVGGDGLSQLKIA